MKLKNKLFTMFLMCFAFFSFGMMNVDAAGEHQFSLKAYDWNAFDNDWEGSGTGEEIADGSILEPGKIIQLAIYYVPGSTPELGMQIGVKYDNTLVEPMYYDGELYVETDMSTTYQGGIWPAAGTSPTAKKQTNWSVLYNDYKAGSYLTFLVSDSKNSATLETEGIIAWVYFKVKDDAPSGSTLNFSYVDSYTTINNSRPKTTSGINFTIQGAVSSNTALHTLTATGNGVSYTSPDFVADDNTVKTYNIIVPNTVDSIDLQATATDATVTGTGNQTLNVGNNKISITVTAGSGATEIYEVIIYRLNNDATLSTLSLTNAVDIGEFNKNTLSYNASVPYKTTSTTISATTTDSKATMSGAGTFNFTNYGNTPNVKEIVVKAEDCDSKYASVEGNICTSKTYIVTVNRTAPSSNKNLSELKVNDVIVSGFDKETLEYTLEDINDNTTSLNVTATAEDSNATVTGTGNITLTTGPNVIEVKVTAEDGTSQTYKINVKKLSGDNTLKSLSITKGTLSPGFTTENKTYTVTMEKDVTVFDKDMITAVANHSGATIAYDSEKTINGDTAVEFTITVTAENGKVETYKLNVKKEKNNDATLKSLTVSQGTLNPVFSAGTTSYTVNVENSVTSIVVTGEATDSNANVNVTGGENLVVGDNTVKVTVTSESGDKKEYTINVVRAGSSDATLKEIKIDGTLIDGFDKDTLEYTLEDIKDNTTSLNVTAQATHSEADVEITGADEIKVGYNTITIKVTAEDGTIQTYKINVKKLSSDNTLKSLSVNKGILSPNFISGTKIYTVTMDQDVAVFNKDMIIAVATDSNAEIVYDSEKEINSDTTVAYTITVTAENGISDTYTLNVKRAKNSDATLKSLTVSDGTLNPEFNANVTSYTVNVENSVTSIVVTGEATDSNASVEIAGGEVLNVGDNTVTVTVTSESGEENIYTINVVRAGSSDATLKEIKIDGTLIDGFNKDTLEYTLEDIKDNTTSLNVTAQANHSEANVTITGADKIEVGDNKIEITVTAEDKTTTKIYIINVKKLSSDNTIKTLSINKGVLDPGFESEIKTYTVTMEEDVTVFNKDMITAVANYSGAEIVYDSEKTINSDTTVEFTITVTAENGASETYILNVKKEKNSNATLKSLTVSEGTLTPVFESGIISYAVNVENSVTSIIVTAEATDPTANVTITGGETLSVGENTVTVLVESESGDKKEYTINVVRAGSSDATLKEIKIEGTLIDGFDKDTLEYTLGDIKDNTTNLNVTAQSNHSEANVTITGADAIEVGNNKIEITVTAEDKTTTKTYTINVKKLSSDATLQSLSINNGTLSPAFESSIKTYDVVMSSDVTKFNKDMITVQSNHNEAEITYSEEIEINTETATEFVITVTAENGTIDTYKLNVKVGIVETAKEITSTKHIIVGDSINTVKLYETALELKNNLDNENEYLEVWSADETTKIADNDKLATGMIVKLIQDDKEVDRKVVVIKGDTSGDGEIDLFDAVKILNHYLEKTPLTNAYEKAAYVNNDDAVDLFDAVMILNHYLGKTSLH